jgi:hypothetical protein
VLAESHVKRRLDALAAIYAQISLVDPDRDRYEALAGDTRAFADTLSMWRVATWLAIVPIAIALVPPVVGVFAGVSFDGWHADTGDLVVLGVCAAFLAVYVGGLLPRAFWRKRELLFPDAGRNAYACEEAAFAAVGRGRPLETRWDYTVAFVAAGLLVLFGPILGLAVGALIWSDVEDIPAPVLLAGYLPGGFAVYRVWQRSKTRIWR